MLKYYAMKVKDIFQGVVDLLYPPLCFCCGEKATEQPLCHKCKMKIKFINPPFCIKCNEKINDNTYICKNCQKKNIFYDRLFCAVYYQYPITNIIHLFKYRHRDSLKEFISWLLITQIQRLNLQIKADYIVPVPIHKVRLREREYNQTTLIAKYVSEFLKIPVNENIVLRKKNRPSQTLLSRTQREKNIQEVFVVNEDIKGKKIVIIDDIFTSGATVNECSKVLKKSGTDEITVFAVAKSN